VDGTEAKDESSGIKGRGPRCVCVLWILCAVCAPAHAHDLERTQVLLTFARDGSFVLDVSNDPAWLRLRRASVPGPFADRVVLWVDGREIRPDSDETIERDGVTTHRLRGRMPIDARTLRWYYGLVIDPYPLTIRRADGRIVVEEIQGDAWSTAIDVSGQFTPTARWPVYLIAMLAAAGLLLRVLSLGRARARGHELL
jgi:hypothetical protein